MTEQKRNMDSSQISPELLETSLRALRNGKPQTPAFLTLIGLKNSTTGKIDFALEELLYDLTWDAYAGLRQSEGLPAIKPQTRQTALEQVALDFRTRNGDLAAWSALYYRYLSGLHLSVQDLSKAASVVPQHFRRRLKQGLGLLALLLTSRSAAEKTPAAWHVNLPLPDFTALVGVQKYLDQLIALFDAPDGPLLVSMEGMGGIGKSALARAFTGLAQTAARWHKIAWVSARRALLTEDGSISPVTDAVTTLEDISARLCDQLGILGMAANPLELRLEALKTVLAQDPHLIVVDNLETVEEYLRLVPTLGSLAGTSRFLITSRQTLREFPFVHTVTLKDLDRESAFEVIQAESARRGYASLISAESFNELYQVIGGHPLALKLVAAQLYFRPLAEILRGFRQAKVGIERLYHHLYWQTWRSLGDPARRLLLSFLPSDPEGEDLEFLQMMSGQLEEEFYTSLKELDQFSLLERSGDAERPLYRLHSLTTTFLQTDILSFWGTAGERD